MLPPISSIYSIGMIRDGGSLAALFFGTNGSLYGLHFQLISSRGPNGEFVRLGYAKPVVFERLEFRDGTKHEWRSINEVEVSWAHATALLHQLGDFLRNDEEFKWLKAMLESADTEGKLPAGIERTLEAVPRDPGKA